MRIKFIFCCGSGYGKYEKKINIGIRIASEEEPKFEFYTSRLGIGYKNIVDFYRRSIRDNKRVNLKMLHFFVDSGIKDTLYFWGEFQKALKLYVMLSILLLNSYKYYNSSQTMITKNKSLSHTPVKSFVYFLLFNIFLFSYSMSFYT